MGASLVKSYCLVRVLKTFLRISLIFKSKKLIFCKILTIIIIIIIINIYILKSNLFIIIIITIF